MNLRRHRANPWMWVTVAFAGAALAFAACGAPGASSMTGPTPSVGAAGRAFPMTASDESATSGALGAKGDLCHVNDDGEFHLINVSQNAVPAHRAHGDAAPGEGVPNNPTKIFGPDCILLSVGPSPPLDPPPGV